jgi:hypothetical protein
MQNAHLRLGLLEYQRATEKISLRAISASDYLHAVSKRN